jgi:ketosteroid isomerase-like protein
MRASCAGLWLLVHLGSAVPVAAQTPAALEAEVHATERAFAQSMADRDLAAFTLHLAEEAVFIGGEVLRGRQAVVDAWSGFFEGAQAPFSWEPETVVVLASGTLALSSGPVRNPAGERVGTFNSTWRREADGRWRIVFDKGCPPCDCGGVP